MIYSHALPTFLALAPVVWAWAMPVGGQAAPGAGDSRREETERIEEPVAAVEAPPASLRVHPAPMPGFDDDAAYLRSLVNRVADLQAHAPSAPTGKVDALLAAANVMLSYQLEPACTRRQLSLPDEAGSVAEGELRQLLDRADGLIAQAREIIQGLHDRRDLPADWWEQSTRRLETLHNFARSLRAYLLSGEADEMTKEARRAASALSPLLEDRSPAVAAAATLWQASLRRRGHEPERALTVLDLALADPPASTMPYAFFARLLRCRLLADSGGYAAAAALLIQIQERCDDWFRTDADRQDAFRTTQLVRIQILTDWLDHLDPTSRSDERQWCTKRIQTLIRSALGGDDNRVLRLTPAVPIVAPVPGDGDKNQPPGAPSGGS